MTTHLANCFIAWFHRSLIILKSHQSGSKVYVTCFSERLWAMLHPKLQQHLQHLRVSQIEEERLDPDSGQVLQRPWLGASVLVILKQLSNFYRIKSLRQTKSFLHKLPRGFYQKFTQSSVHLPHIQQTLLNKISLANMKYGRTGTEASVAETRLFAGVLNRDLQTWVLVL